MSPPPPPYSPRISIDGGSYFPDPYSLHPLPRVLQTGLIPVGILALMSVGASLSLICFICYRFITWRLHYRTFIGYNQYVILVLNLLIADLQQSSAFLISFHWLRENMIVAPSSPCFAQAWLLHSGDVSSGFFVLAIAIHTFYTAVYGKRVGHKMFAGMVICAWIFAYFLTGLGVGLHGYETHSNMACTLLTDFPVNDTSYGRERGAGCPKHTRRSDWLCTISVRGPREFCFIR